jgi:AcrR family transcriptional regulator
MPSSHSTSHSPKPSRLNRQESRLQTQEKLKQAALQEFANAGFVGASIDRIVESAGYTRGAFYANFGNKQELLLALLGELARREAAHWRELSESHGSMDTLFAAFAQRFAFFIEESSWGRFAIEAQLHAQRDPAFAVQYRALMQEVLSLVQALTASHLEAAGKQVPRDIEQVAWALYSLATGLVLNLDPTMPGRNTSTAGQMLARFVQSLVQSAPVKQARET